MRFKLAVVALVAIAALGLTAAFAAPGNGATVVHVRQCDVYPTGTVCIEQRAVYQTTVSKSGNVTVVGNGTMRYTATGTLTYSREDSFHYHSLTKDGVTHVDGDHYTWTESYGASTCTASGRYQFVNGTVRFFDYRYGCGGSAL